jgi:hypothetical protein
VQNELGVKWLLFPDSDIQRHIASTVLSRAECLEGFCPTVEVDSTALSGHASEESRGLILVEVLSNISRPFADNENKRDRAKKD